MSLYPRPSVNQNYKVYKMSDQIYPGPNNPDRFEEFNKKDPIVEQIERDAFKEAMKQIGSSTPCYEKGYIKGATAQDKIATNRTVEAAIQIILTRANPSFHGLVIFEELEKLKQ